MPRPLGPTRLRKAAGPGCAGPEQRGPDSDKKCAHRVHRTGFQAQIESLQALPEREPAASGPGTRQMAVCTVGAIQLAEMLPASGDTMQLAQEVQANVKFDIVWIGD